MKKIDSWMVLLLASAFMSAMAFGSPSILSDQNAFFKDFVNQNFLSFMGVIVTITLASTANIHLVLKKLEKEAGEEFLQNTKLAVRKSSYSLIIALFLSLVIVVIKPVLPANDIVISFANITAVVIILWGLLVLLDITKLAFKL